jgi:hypothetical protein
MVGVLFRFRSASYQQHAAPMRKRLGLGLGTGTRTHAHTLAQDWAAGGAE